MLAGVTRGWQPCGRPRHMGPLWMHDHTPIRRTRRDAVTRARADVGRGSGAPPRHPPRPCRGRRLLGRRPGCRRLRRRLDRRCPSLDAGRVSPSLRIGQRQTGGLSQEPCERRCGGWPFRRQRQWSRVVDRHRVPRRAHARRGPILVGWRQCARRRHDCDRTWTRPCLRFSRRCAVEDCDVESARIPGQLTAGLLRQIARVESLRGHREAGPAGHGGLPQGSPGDRQGDEGHRPEPPVTRLRRQHLSQSQYLLHGQRFRCADTGPLVPGTRRCAATAETRREERTLRRTRAPDPFWPSAVEADADRWRAVGSSGRRHPAVAR